MACQGGLHQNHVWAVCLYQNSKLKLGKQRPAVYVTICPRDAKAPRLISKATSKHHNRDGKVSIGTWRSAPACSKHHKLTTQRNCCHTVCRPPETHQWHERRQWQPFVGRLAFARAGWPLLSGAKPQQLPLLVVQVCLPAIRSSNGSRNASKRSVSRLCKDVAFGHCERDGG
jgi:hypothetical protein